VNKTEAEVFNLIVGVLFGMLLQFGLWLDIDFYRLQWPAIMLVMVGWFVVRDVILGRHKNDKSLSQAWRFLQAFQRQDV
jgi:hypothetical protein